VAFSPPSHSNPFGPSPGSSPTSCLSRRHPLGRHCRAVCHRLPRPPPHVGSQTEELPGRLRSPIINLAPRRLLSLLHSLKWPVLNFHRCRSVASSDPSPHRPDAIKGSRSHGHFTHSVLPHLAYLPVPRATQHQAPMPCSIPLRRRLHSSDEPPVATLGKVPHRRIHLFPSPR
jgi:hypothetical protein